MIQRKSVAKKELRSELDEVHKKLWNEKDKCHLLEERLKYVACSMKSLRSGKGKTVK